MIYNTPDGTIKLSVGTRFGSHSRLAPGLFVNNTGKMFYVSPSMSHAVFAEENKLIEEMYVRCRFADDHWYCVMNKPPSHFKEALIYFAETVLNYWPNTASKVEIYYNEFDFTSTIEQLKLGYWKLRCQ